MQDDKKNDDSRKELRKLEDKADNLRMERDVIKKTVDEDSYRARKEDKMLEEMYNSTTDTSIKNLINERRLENDKRQRRSRMLFDEAMDYFQKEERSIEKTRNSLMKKERDKDKENKKR